MFGSLFKRKLPSTIEDPRLGALVLNGDDWCFKHVVANVEVEITLPNDAGKPNAEAKRVWESSVTHIDALWATTVKFAVGAIAPLNPRFEVQPQNFMVDGISVHPISSFDGGELVFWFRIDGDRDGTYFIPLRDGQPLLWHRDS